ncbi:MAG: hypothetical protein PHH08_01645 [Candidatus ainarchaeum sp.]|nr:hypothetical protein [Candidatus ainarchaeum sp.]
MEKRVRIMPVKRIIQMTFNRLPSGIRKTFLKRQAEDIRRIEKIDAKITDFITDAMRNERKLSDPEVKWLAKHLGRAQYLMGGLLMHDAHIFAQDLGDRYAKGKNPEGVTVSSARKYDSRIHNLIHAPSQALFSIESFLLNRGLITEEQYKKIVKGVHSNGDNHRL